MALVDFFTSEIITQSDGEIRAQITLNPNHPIYNGHFPSVPVVPGVCQVAMLKCIVEQVLNKKLHLKEARDIKFLSMINPLEMNTLTCDINYTKEENDHYKISASLSHEGKGCMKMKAMFTE